MNAVCYCSLSFLFLGGCQLSKCPGEISWSSRSEAASSLQRPKGSNPKSTPLISQPRSCHSSTALSKIKSHEKAKKIKIKNTIKWCHMWYEGSDLKCVFVAFTPVLRAVHLLITGLNSIHKLSHLVQRSTHVDQAVFFQSLHLGICSATTPFVLLGDVLDCLPLDQCDKIFSFVEENVSTWKSVNELQPKCKLSS